MKHTALDSDSPMPPALQDGGDRLAQEAQGSRDFAGSTLDRAAELAQNAATSTIATVKSVRRRADDLGNLTEDHWPSRGQGAFSNLRRQSHDVYNRSARAVSERVAARPLRSLTVAAALGAALTTLILASIRLRRTPR